MFKRSSASSLTARSRRLSSSSSTATNHAPPRTLVLASTNSSTPSLLLKKDSAPPTARTPLTPTREHDEPLFDDAFLSSDLFAAMQSPAAEQVTPFPAFGFPELSKPMSAMDSETDEAELTLEDLAQRVSVYDGDIATRVYIAHVGRPKIVNVSPPPSIRQRPSSMAFYTSSRSNSNSSAHTRNSSYSVQSLRHSRSSSASSLSESASFETPATSPTAKLAAAVEAFPMPPPTKLKAPMHRKGLSSSAPRHLREKIESRMSEDQSRSLQASARSSVSFSENPLMLTTSAPTVHKTQPKGLARKAGGWFRRRNEAELDR